MISWMSDPDLTAELAGLGQQERAAAEELIELRARAERLAARLALDPDDVFVILRHLRRSPRERLSIGLRHGLLASANR